jgi:hypothetical protein
MQSSSVGGFSRRGLTSSIDLSVMTVSLVDGLEAEDDMSEVMVPIELASLGLLG